MRLRFVVFYLSDAVFILPVRGDRNLTEVYVFKGLALAHQILKTTVEGSTHVFDPTIPSLAPRLRPADDSLLVATA